MKFIILILTLLFLNLHNVAAEENEYGIVKAWFNGENATSETVEGIKLKVGEPVEVKIEIISKIKGDVLLNMREPGVTRAFDVIDGPSKEDEWIKNMKVESGWSKTYTWKISPNGAWKNGNAPINIFVQFFKGMDDKIIQFTIANPYILDEQYTGAASRPTEIAPGTTPKAAPFPSALGAIAMLIVVWVWRRLP